MLWQHIMSADLQKQGEESERTIDASRAAAGWLEGGANLGPVSWRFAIAGVGSWLSETVRGFSGWRILATRYRCSLVVFHCESWQTVGHARL
jgi:hypothetical protein